MADIRSNSTALFGEIDRMVVEADATSDESGADLIALVERLLPYSTGLGRQGWFRELEEFLGSDRLRTDTTPYTFPTVEQARTALIQATDASSSVSDSAADAQRHPALARAVFALMTLERLKLLRGGVRDDSLMAVLPGLVAPWPVSEVPLAPRSDPRAPEDNARYLYDNVERIEDRKSWKILAAEAVSPQFAEDSLPCFGTLEDAGGQYCSTLYTESCADDVTVDQVRAIIHPANWDLCYPSFFHAMEKQKPYFTVDGWHRILEEISAEPAHYRLRTALIFSLEDTADGFYINYRLDPNRQGEGTSIGIVEIDNGYLRVTPKNADGTGVRIRTSKEERVSGLSPTATAALGCQLGWGDVAYEMIVGAARRAGAGFKLPANRTVENWPGPAASKQPVDSGPPLQFSSVPATLPINAADAVNDGRDLLTSLIRRVSANAGDAAARWLDGTVREDVEQVTTQLGRDLREWSLEVYQKAQDNVKPPKEA